MPKFIDHFEGNLCFVESGLGGETEDAFASITLADLPPHVIVVAGVRGDFRWADDSFGGAGREVHKDR